MRSITILIPLLFAGSGFASIFDCDYQAPRSVAASAAGITRVVVVARAGSLRVEGRAGATEVRASGTACTSSRDILDRIQLTESRSGSEWRVTAVIPQEIMVSHASLDFTVTVPQDIAAVSVDDTSGSLEIRGLRGNLDVVDTSGEMTIDHVAGDVRITDSSGSITVEHAGSVTIVSDGSGSVDVSDVDGDFRVGHKGSGRISYDHVRGQVDDPRRHR
jgi:hypothetical protein